jgi:MFS family permease
MKKPRKSSYKQVVVDQADSQEPKTEPTPLPLRECIVLCIMQTCDAMAMFQIFPYVSFMVLDFGIVDDIRDVGRYAGYIGSSYSIATLCSAYLWGMAADRCGRRPILILGLACTVICTLLFGLSRSLPWAICSRAMWGLCNGNLGVVKTYIAEVTDDSNRGKALMVLSVAGGLGRVGGNAMGGLLARPTFGGPIFQHYPYLLPNLVSAILSFVGTVLAVLWLKETLPEKYVKPHTTKEQISQGEQGGQEEQEEQEKGGGQQDSCCPERTVLICAGMYGAIAVLQASYMEAFPVWAVNRQADGGIGFSQQDIGLINAITGGAQVIFSLYCYAPLATRIGPLAIYQQSLLLAIPFYVVIAFMPMLASR